MAKSSISTPILCIVEMERPSKSSNPLIKASLALSSQRFDKQVIFISSRSYFLILIHCAIHKTLRVTPAMEAGLAKDIWEIEDIVKLVK